MIDLIRKIYFFWVSSFDENVEYEIRNKVVISNVVALVSILIAILLFSIFYNLGYIKRSWIFVLSVLMLSFVPLLSYKKQKWIVPFLIV